MRREEIQEVLRAARAEGRRVLLESEGYAILAAAGLQVPSHRVIAGPDAVDAALVETFSGDYVILKIVSPDILHKSDVGGVARVRRDVDSLRNAAQTMLEKVRSAQPEADIRGLLVAEAIAFYADTPGTELMVSVKRDRAFGPVLLCGPGGVLTEWYGRLSEGRSHTLFSVENFDGRVAVDALRHTVFGRQALEPSRLFETPPVNGDALAQALSGLADLALYDDEVGGFEEIELNPIVATVQGPVALDALIRLRGPIEATRRPRPHQKVGALLHPRSAAIYGASTSGMNAGRIILRNLKQSEGVEYGRLYAVHPKADRIDGVPCYSSTAELPETVDLAVISVPAERAGDVIEEIASTGKAQSIILIPGGFAETGEGDRARRIQESLTTSRDREDRGVVLVGGNCLGIVSKREYNTFFLPTYKLPFHEAPGESLVCISQSGAYLVTLTSNLDGVIYPRASVSYGNEMDLTASDFLEYYLDHEPDPKVFAFYLEGMQPGEGQRFVRLVRRATQLGRAVVVYKAGKTEIGAKAAASHTAAVAGDYRVAQSLLAEAGAVVCETLNQFEDAVKVLTMLGGRVAKGPRVGVITNAGFECGAASDHLHGLDLVRFSDETRQKLEQTLPVIAHCNNPIDCTPMTDTAAFVKAVEVMAHAPEVDSLVVSAIPVTPSLDVLAPDPAGSHNENLFALTSLPAELGRVFRESDKPMVVAIDSGRLYDPSVLLLERSGIPVYRKIDRATRAMALFTDYGV